MYVVYLKKMTHQFTEQKITQKTLFSCSYTFFFVPLHCELTPRDVYVTLREIYKKL